MITRRPHRLGFTLREIVLSLSISSTVMMLSTGMIRQAFSWSKVGQQRTHDDQICYLLSTELRSHLHLAREVTLVRDTDASSTRVTLQLGDDNKVTYDIDSNRIVMKQWQSGTISRRNDYEWRVPRDPDLTYDESTGEFRLRLSTATPLGHRKTRLPHPESIPVAAVQTSTAGRVTSPTNGTDRQQDRTDSSTRIETPVWRTIQAITGLRLRYQRAEIGS
ncbi:hypothetical protein [Roseiconus lacunae]|uniref:hypothetical protein n=1 Tax=Roseiconus lacunae TaxID=2605694 RepID=UPI001E60D760|nr:hypothetical protein [Roseiconus lacunae]MCD0458308.1 hypothetical protein [Roseiconus lacunae]